LLDIGTKPAAMMCAPCSARRNAPKLPGAQGRPSLTGLRDGPPESSAQEHKIRRPGRCVRGAETALPASTLRLVVVEHCGRAANTIGAALT
jgi:hypothetical protein